MHPPWMRVARGRYAWAPDEDLRLQLLRLGCLVPPGGAVGGWAAAHLHGAVDLDGTAPDGRSRPVLLCAPRHGTPRRPVPGTRWWRSDLTNDDVVEVDGVPVTSPTRTGFDLARLTETSIARADQESVVAVDALLRTSTVSLPAITGYLDQHRHRRGAERARRVLSAACPRTRSCQETRLRLLWTWDAGLPSPLVNQPLADGRTGVLIAEADLFDPEAGMVGEYDGGYHSDAERRAADQVRAERLAALGLRVVRLTAPDLGQFRLRTIQRLRTVHAAGMDRDRRDDAWSLPASAQAA